MDQNTSAQPSPTILGSAYPSAGCTASSSEKDDSPASVAPCDLDAEGLVLSYAFEHGPIAGLAPKHFYSDANRRIYEAILAVPVVDIVAVVRELRRDDRLAQVGGVTYLASLIDGQPATANVLAHVDALKELYRCRVLSDAALELRVELRAGKASSSEAWRRFKAICDEMTADG